MSSTARGPLHFPNLELFVDVVRRHLSSYRVGVSFYIRKAPVAMDVNNRLGHPTSDNLYLRTRTKYTRKDIGRGREVSRL